MNYIALFIVLIVLIAVLTKVPLTISSRWQTFLDGIQISSDEFYALVSQGLQDRQITRIDIAQESFLETHLFSAKRMYLRIIQNEYVIYVCSAPYGTGTFISSWVCIKEETFINKIPMLSKLVGRDRSKKSFYEMDTEVMFRSAVHSTILAAVDSITEAKGKRGLTELDRQYKDFK